jgi:hypothetical protein
MARLLLCNATRSGRGPDRRISIVLRNGEGAEQISKKVDPASG